MEIAGVVAAGVTFGALILKLSQSLYKSAKKIKYASRELMKLVKEMGIFSDLYEDFYRVCVSDQRKKGRSTSSTRHLIDWIKDAIDAFRVLRNSVEALAGDSRFSRLETLTAHVKWFFSENEVKYLRSSLSVARESIRGFSNVTVIETINEEIQVLRAVLAQGDRQAIQALEDQLGATLEDKLDELNWTSRNRRKQRRAIKLRMQEAGEVLQQQSMKIGVSAIVPESKQLFTCATDVEKYAKEVRKQRRTNTTFTAHSSQQSTRADSFQPTNSTFSGSFVSKLSQGSEPVAIASPATSTEELDQTLNRCGKCPGVCICGEIESHPAILTRPSSSDSAPPPRPAGFEHPSHRFDRSWQQPERDNTAYWSTKSTRPESYDDLSDGPPDMEPDSSQRSDDDEYENDDAEEVEEASEDEAQPSPFQPIAGMQGSFPRHWRNRHERTESSDDHWHRRL